MRRTLFVLMLSAMAYALAQTMIIPALPTFDRELHLSQGTGTWLLTAFLLTSTVATPLLGRLGDMYGKERMLLISLAAFGAGSFLSAIADSFAVLLLGRVVQGAGGAIFPLAFGIVRDEFPRERVATSIGLLSSTFGIGGGLGLVLAGLFVDHVGTEWIFWSSLIVTALAALGTWAWVPESPVRNPARIDVPGAVGLSVALGAFLLAISEGNDWGWTSPGVLLLFAVAAVVFGLWTRWEQRVDEPLVDLKLMSLRAVWTTNLTAFAVGFAMFGSYILIPQLAQTPTSTGYGLGLGVTASALVLLPSSLVMLFSGPLAGRMEARIGSKVPLALGCVFTGVAYLMLAALHAQQWEIEVAGALLGLGIGLAFAAMANLVVQAVPAEQTGVAGAVNTISRSIGGAVGAQVTASLVAANLVHGFPAESGFTDAFIVSGAGGMLALAATALIPSVRARRAAAAAAAAQA